jgi:hypothetical protein
MSNRWMLRDVPPYDGQSVAGWFDVALWVARRDALFPDQVGYVYAPSAFAAIEEAMVLCDLWYVALACARALDGSIVYHGFQVYRSIPDREAEIQAEEAFDRSLARLFPEGRS